MDEKAHENSGQDRTCHGKDKASNHFTWYSGSKMQHGNSTFAVAHTQKNSRFPAPLQLCLKTMLLLEGNFSEGFNGCCVDVRNIKKPNHAADYGGGPCKLPGYRLANYLSVYMSLIHVNQEELFIGVICVFSHSFDDILKPDEEGVRLDALPSICPDQLKPFRTDPGGP